MGNRDMSNGTLGMILIGIGGIVTLVASLGFGASILQMSVARPAGLGGVVLIFVGMIWTMIVQARDVQANTRI
jgi:hypothetical protein